MNKAFILNEWIPALRSGEYKQGEGFLYRNGKYCCLGVACDLLIKKGVLSPWKAIHATNGTNHTDENTYYVFDDVDDKYVEKYPPKKACEYTGITQRGHVPSYIIARVIDRYDIPSKYLQYIKRRIEIDEVMPLDWFNDEGFSFDFIADVLEEYASDQTTE